MKLHVPLSHPPVKPSNTNLDKQNVKFLEVDLSRQIIVFGICGGSSHGERHRGTKLLLHFRIRDDNKLIPV